MGASAFFLCARVTLDADLIALPVRERKVLRIHMPLSNIPCDICVPARTKYTITHGNKNVMLCWNGNIHDGKSKSSIDIIPISFRGKLEIVFYDSFILWNVFECVDFLLITYELVYRCDWTCWTLSVC